MTNLHYDLSTINGISFRSATQLRREYHISRATAKVIVSQPGYTRGNEMAIALTAKDGYRLYVRVSDSWMDGSLQDM